MFIGGSTEALRVNEFFHERDRLGGREYKSSKKAGDISVPGESIAEMDAVLLLVPATTLQVQHPETH